MSTASIVIDLKQSTDVVLISEPHKRIQQDATQRVMELLTRFAGAATSVKEDNEQKSMWVQDRVHNAILVNGSRGSGKTTFIRNIFNDIEEAKSGNIPKLEVLSIIDPTLVEGKENVIITIVSLIAKKCEDYYNDRKLPPKGDEKHQKYKEKLKKLAGGFSLLEGVGSQSAYDASWDDPQHVMNRGLDRARSGSEFETCFHEFINCALDFIGKSAFILAFDDIDTKFEKGWPVLEILRKYLTTPRLILLISGDLGLYSQLVRREQYLNLGDNLLRHDRPHRDHHGADSLKPWTADPLVRMVDRLEEQYLQKVLKPENRVTLSTLAEIEAGRPRRHTISVKTSENPEEELTLSKFIDRILEAVIFVTDSGDTALYRRAILSQPLRTVIQFLKAGDKVVAEGENVKPGTLNEFRASLPNIFASALYHKNLDPIAVATGDPDTLIAQMIAWSESTDSWETTYRLRPDYDNADQNMVAIVFACQFAKVFNEEPGQALTYMIKLGLTREFMLQRERVTSHAIVQALGLDMRERPSSVARRAVGVQRSLSRRELGLDHGTIPVSGATIDIPNMIRHLYAGKAEGSKSSDLPTIFKNHVKEIDERSSQFGWRPILAWWKKSRSGWRPNSWRGYVYNTLSSLTQKFERAQVTHLAACVMSDARSQDRAHISIFPLIACLGEFLEISTETDDSERLAQVHKAFVRLCQLRSYPVPSFSLVSRAPYDSPYRQGRSRNAEELDEDDSNFDEGATLNIGKAIEELGLDAFLEHFDIWIKESSNINLKLPPHIYSRIITRLYYTLTRMDDELTSGVIYTGSMLHRQIVAFLHSILVEEMLASGVKRRVSQKKNDIPTTAEPILDNPTTSDTPFWQNFPFKDFGSEANYNGNAEVDFTGLPLFRLIFSCPLWALFLMPQTVVSRGNKAQGWKILDQQLRCWPAAVLDETEMERRRHVIQITDNEIGPYDNLWAPLNSVPVLKLGPMQRAVWDSKPIDPSDWLPAEQRVSTANADAESTDMQEPVTQPLQRRRRKVRHTLEGPVTDPKDIETDNGQGG